MPTNLNTLFPFDPSGSVNRILAETSAVAPNSIIVPEHSPFYSTNLVIRDQNGVPLTPAEYIQVTPVNKHILRSSIDAYFGFKIKKSGVTSITYDYYSVGGDFSINQQAATDLRVSLSGIQDDIQYNQITNLPTSFPPIYHLHPAHDVSWPGLLYTLQRLSESLAFRDSAVMEQVYQYLDLRTGDIEVDINILNPNQVSIYWKSTGFCICIGEIFVNDDTGKEVFHNFRREFLTPPKLSPDVLTIYPILANGLIGSNSQIYHLVKLTATGFAIHKGIYSVTADADLARGKAMKRMYMAMGISSANATTSDISNIVRNYP